jgi:hypothetical protein
MLHYNNNVSVVRSIQCTVAVEFLRLESTNTSNNSTMAIASNIAYTTIKHRNINVNGMRVHRVSECIVPPNIAHLSTLTVMSQQYDMELLTQKNRVVLAMQAMKIDTYLSQWPAVAICNVLQSTLSRRLARTTSRRDFRANSSRLTKHEEDTLVLYIKKLDARGFAPTLGNVRDIVNRLHAVRGGSQVSKNGLATSSVASLSSNLNTLDGAITRESYTVILRSLAPSSTLHRIQRGSTVS